MMLREMTSFCDINYDVIDEWRNDSLFYSYLQILKNTDVTNKGNNKITELRTILQRESPNS